MTIAFQCHVKAITARNETEKMKTTNEQLSNWSVPGEKTPFKCKYCGSPSWIDPSEQSLPRIRSRRTARANRAGAENKPE